MDEKMVCAILEVKYLKMFGREITYDPYANIDLYPYDWYQIYDYKLKAKMMSEALDKKIKIQDTDLYMSAINPNIKTR